MESIGYMWWHHYIEMLSALLAFYYVNPLVQGEYLLQWTRKTDLMFSQLLTQQLNKQWSCGWYEMSLRLCDVTILIIQTCNILDPHIDGILPKGPTRHAYAWQIGPFWQDTLNMCGDTCTTKITKEIYLHVILASSRNQMQTLSWCLSWGHVIMPQPVCYAPSLKHVYIYISITWWNMLLSLFLADILLEYFSILDQ